jgi:hypothetical protein
MDELSKLLQIKEYVLEIKLQLAKLHTKKEEAIQSQYYERAADIRQQEKDLHSVLLSTRMILQESKLPPLLTSVTSVMNFSICFKQRQNDFHKIKRSYLKKKNSGP